MARRSVGNRPISALAVGVGLTILVAVFLGWMVSARPDRPANVAQPAQASNGEQLRAKTPPDCPARAGKDSLQVTIAAAGPVAFHPDCLYARAGIPFTIEFRNLVVALDGGGGINANISIYPDQASAVAQSEDGGIQTGEEAQRQSALFIGTFVQGPGSTTYQVPALPAGTYYVQSDSTPFLLVATLVVS